MTTSPLLLLHICSAPVGLISGALAMLFRKGSGMHRIAGNVFFLSMLCMSGAGAYMAAFWKPNAGNFMVGVLTFYWVATGWVAASRREGETGVFDLCALVVAAALGTAGVTWGLEAARSQTGLKYGYPAGLLFLFGSIALLFAAADVRMIVRGGVFGTQRIARHLWRMCMALLMTTVSFYPGRAEFFPTWLRRTNLLYVPHVLLIGAMLFWLVRMSARKRKQRNEVMGARHGEAIAMAAAGTSGAM